MTGHQQPTSGPQPPWPSTHNGRQTTQRPPAPQCYPHQHRGHNLCQDQLVAIKALRALLQSTNMHTHTTPTAKQINTPPTVSPPAPPPRVDPQMAPPRVDDSGWMVVQQWSLCTINPRPMLPIATRTWSHTRNAFAALATNNDNANPVAMPVLGETTRKLLERRQLRCHPTHKAMWDTSYANELGRLCQGVGCSTANPLQPRVARTDTFRPIHLQDIPTTN